MSPQSDGKSGWAPVFWLGEYAGHRCECSPRQGLLWQHPDILGRLDERRFPPRQNQRLDPLDQSDSAGGQTLRPPRLALESGRGKERRNLLSLR
jgi:hypothetical protein